MFLIKFILVAAILLVVLLIGVEFSTLNADLVTIKYLLGATTIPLSLAMISAFAVGALLAALIGASMVLPLRWQLNRLRQAVLTKDQEINLLAKKVGRDIR